MDILTERVKTVYFKYLRAAFGSALISSIYGVVDMAMVGQYHGPDGTAALAVVAPVWNIIYSLGLLTGIGGSVIFSTLRGSADNSSGSENRYFTASVIYSVLLAALAWAGLLLFERPVLLFFGADENLLSLAQRYLLPIKFVFPVFLFNQMLSAFLRNDNAPTLAAAGVLAGGIFNIFGDYFCVFVLDMGIFGAGLATAIGSVVSLCVLLLPFNIFSTYYFQAIMKPSVSFIVSVARGLVVSGILILLLPCVSGVDSIWFAMPLTELVVMLYAAAAMKKYTEALPEA